MSENFDNNINDLNVLQLQEVQEAQSDAPVKTKKTKKRAGVKIFAVLMCVMFLISAATSGVLLNFTLGVLHENQSASALNQNSGNNSGLTNTALVNGNNAPLTVSDVISKVKPSVVCIETTSQVSLNNYYGFFGFGGGNQSYTQQGAGSGFILTADGYIATNYHVVQDADSITVVLNSGKQYDAQVIGYDADADLAVIKINAANLTVATLGNSDAAVDGAFVVAIGCPGGIDFAGSSTFGIISAVNRQIAITDTRNMTVIQTDAAINPGNSGGPLVNMNGQVIGINAMKLSSSDYEGMGFAIPISSAKPILDDMRKNGTKTDSSASSSSGNSGNSNSNGGTYIYGNPGSGSTNNGRNSNNSNNSGSSGSASTSAVSFGITGSTVTSAESTQKKIPQGFKIASIDASGACANSGLQIGDIITAVDGSTVKSVDDLTNIKNNHKSGDKVTVTVYRNGDSYDFTVTLK
ncbi:MAG: trypsin-like peptidase domain-containing protein [Oscillospiraceae bacterium]|nr:trypsin-like peptidase domain-containing protein [Oscillospiraceae bacterium]